MEYTSKFTVHYEGLLITVSISMTVLEIEATNTISHITYVNTFEINNTIDYNEVLEFIKSGKATIFKEGTEMIKLKCGFNNFCLYPAKVEDTKLLKVEINILRDQVQKLEAEIAKLKEQVQKNNLEGSYFAVKSSHGTYIRAFPGGEGARVDLQTKVGVWERFQIIKL